MPVIYPVKSGDTQGDDVADNEGFLEITKGIMSAALPEFVDQLILDGTKVGYWPERIAAWERGEKIAPVTIDCSMTRACNVACHFCALPGTEILLVGAAKHPIEEVCLGAQVVSAEGNDCRVIGTMSRLVEKELIFTVRTDSEEVNLTGDHPVLTKGGYKPVRSLNAEYDCVRYLWVDGATESRWERISEVVTSLYSGPVYNLEVSGDNSYVADGIGVHNCYASLQASEGEKITKQNFFDFLDDAAEIGVKGVSFISDGESTVVPWYADAVEYAAKVGLKVGAGSNGVKLTKPVLERILPYLSYLRFNFSAGERKRYAEIMGCPQHFYDDVIQNIKDGMEIINRDRLGCTLNTQMVCDPKDGDQLIPFAKLACELRPTYAVIKHCADNVEGTLGVDYSKYAALDSTFDEIERMGKEAGVRIEVKRGRLDGKRTYTKCFGPPFITQISGNGTCAPCGFMFNEKYKTFHFGNITRQRYKDVWSSERYWEVMRYLASEHFNPQQRCGPNCLQHNTNTFLFNLVNGRASLPTAPTPPHLEFI